MNIAREASGGIRRIVREDIEVATDRHLLTSTQRLVAPLVIAQELQRHLTSVDLQLDPTMKAQYIVARELLWILHEGTTIAEADPVIDYRTADGHKEPRQHLTFAQLQRLVDVFTQSDTDGVRRPIKLSELGDRKGDQQVAEVLNRMKTLFTSSSASSTPVLWRLLLAQASLMHVLIDLVDRGSANVERVLPVDIEDFAWSPVRGQSFEAQIRAVDSYLRQKLNSSRTYCDGVFESAQRPSRPRAQQGLIIFDRARMHSSAACGAFCSACARPAASIVGVGTVAFGQAERALPWPSS